MYQQGNVRNILGCKKEEFRYTYQKNLGHVPYLGLQNVKKNNVEGAGFELGTLSLQCKYASTRPLRQLETPHEISPI